jgi:hypothetical protein
MMLVRTIYIGIVTAALATLAVSAVGIAKPSASTPSTAVHACGAVSIVAGQSWQLEYSFGATFAPGIGALNVVVHSTGASVVTARRYNRPRQVKHLQLPPSAIAKFVKILNTWPPACIHTLQRGRYHAFDMRSIEITFTTPSLSTSAVVGPDTYVNNSRSFEAICNALAIVKPYLGSTATWSATRLTPIRGEACYAEAPAPNISVSRTLTPLRGVSAGYLGR